MLKNMKWSSLLLAILYIVGGVMLLFFPQLVMDKIGLILGIVLIVLGLIRMISYLFVDVRETLHRNDFVEGISYALIGGLIIYLRDTMSNIIPLIFAIIILINGFSKIQDGIDSRRLGYQNHALFLVLAVVCIASGLLILFNVFKTDDIVYKVIGGTLLYCGITDFVTVFFLMNKFQKYIKQLEEKETVEVANPPVEQENVMNPIEVVPSVTEKVDPYEDSAVSEGKEEVMAEEENKETGVEESHV